MRQGYLTLRPDDAANNRSHSSQSRKTPDVQAELFRRLQLPIKSRVSIEHEASYCIDQGSQDLDNDLDINHNSTFTNYAKRFMSSYSPNRTSETSLIFSTTNQTLAKKTKINTYNNYKASQEKKRQKRPIIDFPSKSLNYSSYDMQENNTRFDTRGVPIKKGSKKHKVTFIDTIWNKDVAEVMTVKSNKPIKSSPEVSEKKFSEKRSVTCCTIY